MADMLLSYLKLCVKTCVTGVIVDGNQDFGAYSFRLGIFTHTNVILIMD